MVETVSQNKKLSKDPIIVDHSFMVAWSSIIHDTCWRIDESKTKKTGIVTVEQGACDLPPSVHDETDELVATFARFGVSDEVFRFKDLSDKKELNRMRGDIKKRIASAPNQTFLIVYAISGMGQIIEGKQSFVINKCMRGGYDRWPVE